MTRRHLDNDSATAIDDRELERDPDTDRHQEADNDSAISCTHGHPSGPGLPNRFPIEEGPC